MNEEGCPKWMRVQESCGHPYVTGGVKKTPVYGEPIRVRVTIERDFTTRTRNFGHPLLSMIGRDETQTLPFTV